MRKIFISALAGLSLCSCGMSARHVTTQGKQPSSVKVINLRLGEAVLIDQQSLPVGSKNAVVATLPDGWHVVRVSSGGGVVLEQRVFLQDGIQRVIDASVR